MKRIFKQIVAFFRGPFQCPECESWDTCEDLEGGWCNECGYEDDGY